MNFTISRLRFAFCLRRVKYTFTGSVFVLDCIIALNRGNLILFPAAKVGADHITDKFSTIECRIISPSTPEAMQKMELFLAVVNVC